MPLILIHSNTKATDLKIIFKKKYGFYSPQEDLWPIFVDHIPQPQFQNFDVW